MQGGGRLLQLFLTGHGDGGAFAARLAALRRLGLGFCRCFRGSALLTIRRGLRGGFPIGGGLFRDTLGGSSTITLSGVSSGTETAALGSAVGVWTSVFSGVWLVLVSLSSPPSTAAIRAFASLTEFSSGFMT